MYYCIKEHRLQEESRDSDYFEETFEGFIRMAYLCKIVSSH